jgi:hypothetical protein
LNSLRQKSSKGVGVRLQEGWAIGFLPVWVCVSKEEVYEYSPTLLLTKGIDWKVGEDEVCSSAKYGDFGRGLGPHRISPSDFMVNIAHFPIY